MAVKITLPEIYIIEKIEENKRKDEQKIKTELEKLEKHGRK